MATLTICQSGAVAKQSECAFRVDDEGEKGGDGEGEAEQANIEPVSQSDAE